MRNTNLSPWPSRPGTRTALVAIISVLIFSVTAKWTFQGLKPLQQFYFGQYLYSELTPPSYIDTYRLLQAVSRRGDQRQVREADVQAGETRDQNGKRLPLQLSEDALKEGYSALQVVHSKPITSSFIRGWLRGNIYDNRSILQVFATDCILAVLVLMAGCLLAGPFERKAALIRKYGRQIRGPVAVTVSKFNSRFNGNGIGITVCKTGLARLFRSQEPQLRLPLAKESSGILTVGYPGTGKTAILMQVLQQVRARGERAVIYDPHGEFITRFFRPDRDVILNPWDVRGHWWDLAAEVTHPAVTLTIANSLFPEVPGEHEFFARVCRQIQAYLLRWKPDVHEFADWLSDPKMIEKLLRETALTATIDPAAGPQRVGVFSTLSLVVEALKSVPPREECRGSWDSAGWARSGNGWIFLTSEPMSRPSLRPLHSAWFDLLILRLLNTMEAIGPKTWLVLDELASLHRLPQLVSCLVETRKTGNPIVYGFQSQSQIKAMYGPDWDPILSVPYAKFFMRTTSPDSKDWMSLVVGDVEVERLRDEKRSNESGTSTQSETWEFPTHRLILASEFGGLDDLQGFLVVGGTVTEFRTHHPELPKVCKGFISRPITEVQAAPADDDDNSLEVFN